MNIQWDYKFEIGHERIDFEHRIFLGLIKDLDDAVYRGDPRERQLRIVREIQRYAEFHFLSEENIMLDVGYPGYDEHHVEHQRLLVGLDDRAKTFAFVDEDSGEGLVQFLFEWFSLHTTQVDKRLASFVEAAANEPS